MGNPWVLFLNVLVVATCGLIYELLAGTLASYVLGDSVTQFSLIIGLYLCALGVGAWLSKYVGRGLARRFVEIELAVALVGGFSASLLFLGFAGLGYAHVRYFHVLLYGLVLLIGVLVGLELPLLMRILQDRLEFKELVSRVLTFDYLGSLVAAVLFPLLLVPQAGLIRTALIAGLLNAGVGLWATFVLRPLIPGHVWGLRVRAVLVILVLTVGLAGARRLTSLTEEYQFEGKIVAARTTPYQRIVVTQGTLGHQLYLNRHLQFSEVDEYRYHEALAHPALLAHGAPRRVLILGGGDGLALREVLKYPTVAAVTLVDIDPDMTGWAAELPPLARLNEGALHDPRVSVVNEDALLWLQKPGPSFDVALADFPDPSTYAVSKLFTVRFYRLLKSRLAPDAALAVQCTSPLFARQSYWCIIRTLEAAGFHVRPYQAAVPSFGIWGFALARLAPFTPPSRSLPGLRFLDDAALAALFVFSPDLGPVSVETNRLDNQVLVRYYESEWGRFE